eukprot:g2718.t1
MTTLTTSFECFVPSGLTQDQYTELENSAEVVNDISQTWTNRITLGTKIKDRANAMFSRASEQLRLFEKERKKKETSEINDDDDHYGSDLDESESKRKVDPMAQIFHLTKVFERIHSLYSFGLQAVAMNDNTLSKEQKEQLQNDNAELIDTCTELSISLLNNRAAVGLKLGGLLKDATDTTAVRKMTTWLNTTITDCSTCLTLRETSNPKALFRKGHASLLLKKFPEAKESFRTLLKEDQENKAAKRFLKIAIQREKQAILREKKRKQAQNRKKKKDAAKKMSKKKDSKSQMNAGLFGGLYNDVDQNDLMGDDKEAHLELDLTEEGRLYRKIVKMIREKNEDRIMIESGAHTHGGPSEESRVDVTFQKFLDPIQFRRTLFPGYGFEDKSTKSKDGPKDGDKGPPSDLVELVLDKRYAPTLKSKVIEVQKKADAILAKVQRGGAQEGWGKMDALTESRFRPQMLLESFAQCIKSSVDEVHRKQHLATVEGKDAFPLASPYGVCAMWEQIPATTLPALAERGYSPIEKFFGKEKSKEWTTLVYNDLKRYHTAEKTSFTEVKRGKTGIAIHWAQQVGTYAETYPAMYELFTKLQGLPFELNRKAKWKLTKPVQTSIAIIYLDPRTGDQTAQLSETALAEMQAQIATHGHYHQSQIETAGEWQIDGSGQNGIHLSTMWSTGDQKGRPIVDLRMRKDDNVKDVSETELAELVSFKPFWMNKNKFVSACCLEAKRNERPSQLIPLRGDQLLLWKSRVMEHSFANVTGEGYLVCFFMHGPQNALD